MPRSFVRPRDGLRRRRPSISRRGLTVWRQWIQDRRAAPAFRRRAIRTGRTRAAAGPTRRRSECGRRSEPHRTDQARGLLSATRRLRLPSTERSRAVLSGRFPRCRAILTLQRGKERSSNPRSGTYEAPQPRGFRAFLRGVFGKGIGNALPNCRTRGWRRPWRCCPGRGARRCASPPRRVAPKSPQTGAVAENADRRASIMGQFGDSYRRDHGGIRAVMSPHHGSAETRLTPARDRRAGNPRVSV